VQGAGVLAEGVAADALDLVDHDLGTAADGADAQADVDANEVAVSGAGYGRSRASSSA